MLTNQELQNFRNLGHKAKEAADEIVSLRYELESTRAINLTIVRRLQGEIDRLRKELLISRKYEQWAMSEASELRDAQERADDAYRAASSGY